MSLDNIPFGVYLHFMMYHLSIKEVGILSTVNKNLREIFSNNQIWKSIYMRTNELEITDTSIHIGPYSCYYDSSPIEVILRDYKVCKPIYWGNNSTIWSIDSCYTGCCNNIFNYIDSMANTVNVDMNINKISEQSEELQKEYYEKIRKIHIEENKKHGFSLKNLCTNKNHYIKSTLVNSEGLKNCKSYKFVTLKKLKTVKNKKRETIKKKLEKKAKILQRAMKETQRLDKEYKELEDARDEIERFCSKVDNTLQGKPISSMEKVDNVRKK